MHAESQQPSFEGSMPRKRRTQLYRAMIVLQAVGAVAAVGAAVYDIESIVWTGPVFMLIGLAIVFVSFRRRRTMGLCFGLTAPTMTMACFSLICGLEWSPPNAQAPVSAMLVFFLALHLPLGWLAWAELRAHSAERRPPDRFQFGIAALLVLTLALAVGLGVSVRGGQAGIAVGVFLGYAILVAYLLRSFHRRRGLAYNTPTGAESSDAGP